jgi:hypothetical protein
VNYRSIGDLMIDPIAICIYCSDIMEAPTKEQIKIFGKPSCCGYDMLYIEREKIHTIVRSLDKLKKNLEDQILKGMEQ